MAQVCGHRLYIYAADKHASLVDLASTVRGHAIHVHSQSQTLHVIKNNAHFQTNVMGVD